MTVAQFLSTLTAPGVNVTLKDLDTGDEIVTIKAAGYASLDDTVEAKVIKQWYFTNTSALTCIVANA